MSNSLTPRERFNRAVRFQTVDRLPVLACGLWPTTKERWHSEGMRDVEGEFAAFDGPMQSCWLYGQYQGPLPSFEEKTLEETDAYCDAQNYLGQKERLLKSTTSMPFWEDNCYNHGLLHSPQVFREFMAPGYRELVSFFRSRGIDMITVDSDGNVAELIPLLLDAGITGLHPFEVAAGMDVVQIGRQYPKLQMWGGIDKRALARDTRAIYNELQRVIPAMKRRGGYAACLDHGVPSDVSLENYRYYVRRLLEMSVIN